MKYGYIYVILYTVRKTTTTARRAGGNKMTRFYKTGADRKPQEISKQEADKMVERNQDIFNQVLNGADFSKLLEIEIPLKIER